jgi:hypothetical protein
VFDEIVVAGAGLTGAREVEGANWLQVEDVPVVDTIATNSNRGGGRAGVSGVHT